MNHRRIIIASLLWLSVSARLGEGSAPQLDIIYPPGEKFITTSSSIPIAGRVKACDGCAVSISGFETEIKPDGSFSTEVRLAAKQSVIYVKLLDGYGVRVTKLLNVTTTADIDAADTFQIISPEMTASRAPRPDISSEEPQEAPASAPVITPASAQPKSSLPANAKLSAFEYHINGKPAASQQSYIISDRVFAAINSPAFSGTGAVSGPGGKSLIFHLPAPLKSPFVSLDDSSLSDSFTHNGETYLPVRAALEKAGWSVHWQTGRIYLAPPCAPSYIEISSSAFRDRRKVETLIHKNAMYASAESLAVAAGLKYEKLSDSTIRLSGNGKTISITRSAGRNADREISLTLMSDASPPETIPGPGPAFADIENIVPVRAALAILGFEMEWDSALKRALAEHQVVVGTHIQTR